MFTPCLNSEVRADQLLREHPRTIIQMAETCWYNAAQRPPLYPMPRLPPVAQNYRVLAPSSWDHLIYAYMIESTHICEIFRKVSALYKSGAQLPPPSTASRQFWFMADSVILSPPQAICVWTSASRTPEEEDASRHVLYRNTFAHGLSSADENRHAGLAQSSTPDFFANLEAFLGEAWRGIVQQRSPQGLKDTNHQKLASLATVLSNQLVTWRERTNLTLEEFRAVGFASMLHVVLSVNSVVVTDLGATAVSCAERLALMAKRCGIAPNPRANALFEISRPLSAILKSLELGYFNDVLGARWLCSDRGLQDLFETVIGLYPEAVGKDLAARKTDSVALPANVRGRRVLALASPD
jgi:hypothetical protein